MTQPAAARPPAWLVIARNALPVVGVHVWDWPLGVVMISYWLDGASLLAALVGIAGARVVREDLRPKHGPVVSLLLAVLVFIVGLGLLGAPYWLVLAMFLTTSVLGAETWSMVLGGSLTVAVSFAGTVIGNLTDALLRGLATMPEPQARRHNFWMANLLLARGAAIILAVPLMKFGGIAIIAGALAWLELNPLKALQAVGAPVDDDDVPEG